MSRAARTCLVVVLLAAGCGEEPADLQTQRGAETVYGRQHVSVSAYWDPTNMANDFETLYQWDYNNRAGNIESVVINLGCEFNDPWSDGKCDSGINGGPGSQYDPNEYDRMQALFTWIQKLQSINIAVFGYVDLRENRPAADVQTDIYAWGWYIQGYFGGHLNGIFFDEAGTGRSDATAQGALAREEAFTSYAQSYLTIDRVIFNYGAAQPWNGTVVSCMANYDGMFNWFVTEETTLAQYQGIDRWGVFGQGGRFAWANGYLPDHFINIVNEVPTNTTRAVVDDAINESRILNAGQFYMKETTNGDPNTYGHLAQNSIENPGMFPLFNYVEGDSGGQAEYDHGGTIDPPQSGCVPEDPNAAE